MENKLKSFNELKELINKLEKDIHKFYEKGNETAGIRVSKGMQKAKIMAKQVRLDIFVEKKIILEAKAQKKLNKNANINN